MAVIGAGVGGLGTALRLARAGIGVTIFEARDEPGGLAGDLEIEGLPFDVGPYILLDRPGLAWAFESLGLDLDAEVPLRRIEQVYSVESPAAPAVTIAADLDETCANLERHWPGSGTKYRELAGRLTTAYQRLIPIQQGPPPRARDLLRTGAWRSAGYLFRPLRDVLGRAGLPKPVVDALAIWSHVAGQSPGAAPAPLAFVAATIHGVGACYPADGLGAIPRVLARAAIAAGVELRLGTPILAIRRDSNGRVSGVETQAGEFIAADSVVSDAGGVGTYLELTGGVPARFQARLKSLPLQSPGACAYLAIRGSSLPNYLRFHLPGGGSLCRLLIRPSLIRPGCERDGWAPARLIAPMLHADAERLGPDGQREFLGHVLDDPWWHEAAGEFRVLRTRVPADWGREFHQHRDSMNPVMTARFMRQGRLAHRSSVVPGLYLTGSSTHPGQWVSFCAISGVLAADRVIEDRR